MYKLAKTYKLKIFVTAGITLIIILSKILKYESKKKINAQTSQENRFARENIIMKTIIEYLIVEKNILNESKIAQNTGLS